MPEVKAPFLVRYVLVEGPHVPCRLATGRLYLDDVRSHVSHLLATPLPLLIGELQHPQPAKGPCSRSPRRRRTGICDGLIPFPLYGGSILHDLPQVRIIIQTEVLRPERSIFEAVHQLLVADAYQPFKDFFVVSADQGSGSAVERRCLRHLEGSILKRPGPQRGMLHVPVHLSMPKLWIVVHTVLAILNGHGGNPRRLTPLHNLVLAQGYRPRLNPLVQLFLVL